ncbi:hypothetical protein [Phaeobacter gallaeciensis]|uniref:hypothetical protein n=1 Tax=Phaeobacter gallaeciensis TaxID=60890 RepID=UPI00237F6706|nr:hypothetical protein [Phaeobacter gallaeciensis]MDE4098981.1 hypothetical protein [Phaeobacter gallaeciensis]MDE4107791.1 hypothetical protein [Phaeobacter gallaeciensis]MDE4112245.1 hypothetical protein [Phaeobacter gallaeciensis]MDE4116717.1 hypothetical protein [Phaeobacter gallaeciensis]MDE4121187.1 hypothetical protein [Phaeobacter gallaeciensis]
MRVITREALEQAPIELAFVGTNNGKSRYYFEGYGHIAKVVFGFDRKWGAEVDNSGKLFDENCEAEAIAYAEQKIRDKLIARLEAAAKFRDDIAPLLKSS